MTTLRTPTDHPTGTARGAATQWISIPLAVAAALAIWAAARAADVNLAVGGHRIDWPGVAFTAGLAAAAGVAVLRFLQRRHRNGRSVWAVIATITLFLSLAGPFGAATTAATIALVGMHAAVYLVLIGVAWTTPSRRVWS